MDKQEFKLQDFTIDYILELANIYLSEWQHRDEILWKQVFKYFYANLVVLFCPILLLFYKLIYLLSLELLFLLFPYCFLQVFYIYIYNGYVKRLEASSSTYQNILNYLPIELRRVSLLNNKTRHGKIFYKPMSKIYCLLMFICIFALSVVMIVYYCVL